VSERNLELMRRFNEAVNARDVDALIALSDPDIELHSAFAAVGGETYRGHDGLRRWQGDLAEAWGAELRVEPEAFFALGEDTLLFSTYHARGQQSGAAVAMPATTVGRVRDSRVSYVKVYMERADALRDLGVSEDELEPIEP
jgi:ketosteroid isomerase-like protein